MRTLKKIISRYIQIISLFLIILLLLIMVSLQTLTEQKQACETATRTFEQMELILEENQKELTELETEYSQTCLHNAEAIAYLIQENPSILEDVEELKKIAVFTEVDEIHIFDNTGRIYAGTHPQYYNLTFDSGEQMQFFKPMLEDKSLKLVQEITPNTAEEKLMQYSALWSSNGEFIVQVGMEPVSVMKVTAKNELSYIFSLFRLNPEVDYYAIDTESGEIIGSTDLDCVGENLAKIGLNFEDVKNDHNGFHAKINGKKYFCVFKEIGTNYIGRVISNDDLYKRLPTTIAALAVCLILIAIILVYVITRYMNRYVVNGIESINEKLNTIAKGNLDETVDIQSSVEFAELSNYINAMFKSILDNNKKMSYVLSKTNMYIGVYEYNKHMKKVRITEYIPKIFSLDTATANHLSSDYKIFRNFIEQILKNPVPNETGIFQLNTEDERYIRLEEITSNDEIFGVAIDVTDEIIKRHEIEVERDIDLLTGLFNRRGLDSKLSILFDEPEKLGYSAIIMIDADGLKKINDTYGHEKGDIYLKKISEILEDFGQKSSIAARQGGDEFILFLYQYDTEEELLKTIHTLELLQNNSTAQLDENLSVPLRFSFGFSLINENSDYQLLIQEADKKMYENKRERKKMLNKA